MISEREKLSRTIREINHKGYLSGEGELQAIVDWVIADRARIVEPLVSEDLTKYSKENLIHLIEISLKLAGIQ